VPVTETLFHVADRPVDAAAVVVNHGHTADFGLVLNLGRDDLDDDLLAREGWSFDLRHCVGVPHFAKSWDGNPGRSEKGHALGFEEDSPVAVARVLDYL
jgi:hypothetical protein